MNRNELLASLESNRDRTARLFEIAQPSLDKSYAPGKWSVRQILTHLADVELVLWWRFSRAAAEPGASVELFDHDVWVDSLCVPGRSLDASKAAFLGGRALFIDMVRTLPEDVLQRTCLHPEHGPVAAHAWAAMTAKHCNHHADQVEAICEGRPWPSPKA